ncbi:hypothetical protein M2360_003065 [Rhizobium sp. SG_E_25_P2]|uniref:DUF4167 domain-containing protein n=1 Tax=Rhizobium sp. SG_E_25_P2 TaxID=2879942 RepID=UPI002475DA6E|nr:DUF4167 domain-containing protein [Rhizobium sp. SG_E_25_P2]MDH6267668.1 hypothetical protein [Rhizobium sp. SG_E_25_P2]
MRPGQQKQRSRGRSSGGNNNNSNNNNNNNNNNGRKGQNPLTRTYDSSGPDVKVRGTAQTIAEKYMTLARDASSSGDRVMAENYLQHAEHYNRIIAAAQAMYQERFQRDDRLDQNQDRQDYSDRDEDDGENGGEQSSAEAAYQPQPQPQVQPQQQVQPSPPQVQPKPQHKPAPRHVQPQVQPQPIIDESTPQPVIEGVPAEVQIETESAQQDAKPAGEKSPRRRSAGRPRRTPRAATADAEGGETAPEPATAE